MINGSVWKTIGLLALLGVSLVGCDTDPQPQTDSQTNWLRACETNADCGNLTCHCGACTHLCNSEEACADLGQASCVPADDTGTVALCGGAPPPSGSLCLPRCNAQDCGAGQSCVAGVCGPLPDPTVDVVVDPSAEYQSLVGFGATLAYAEGEVTSHPAKMALYEAMFANLGLDVVRLRNRYEYPGDDDLGSATELVEAATESLGRQPLVILTSWSPPPALKANGATLCQDNDAACTLRQTAEGTFDYAGYASYWRNSLDAYADSGLHFDYIGLQNSPDYVPAFGGAGEACKFLPVEGTQTVSIHGKHTPVLYPGFAEALRTVAAELSELASPPKIVAPETAGGAGVSEYLPALDRSLVGAVGHHMYGTDPRAVDTDLLGTLATIGQDYGQPLFQTEMQADGMGTATLIHHSLVVEGVSMYLQAALVGPSHAAGAGQLIALGSDGFALEDAYHALRHYAFYTDPGYIRVDARSDTKELLASAWVSPKKDAMTLVLVNGSPTTLHTRLTLMHQHPGDFEVVRTVFSGTERSAQLGRLSDDGIVTMPAGSIVTVALTAEGPGS